MVKGALVASLIGALAGCALKAPPESGEIRQQALPNLAVPAQWVEKGGVAGAIASGWLATFADPKLDALVREAIANNPDLRSAAARVEQAAGYAKAAGATLYPQVNLLARTRPHRSSSQFTNMPTPSRPLESPLIAPPPRASRFTCG
jgi:multidrug efflux system outer membrane protein